MWAQWPFVTAGNINCQPHHMQGLHPRLYECPPSYVLHLPRLLRGEVPLRPASFVEPGGLGEAASRHSRLSLHPCEMGGSPAENTDDDSDDDTAKGGGKEGRTSPLFCTPRGVPLMRAGRSAGAVAAALRPLRRVRLLHVHHVQVCMHVHMSHAHAHAHVHMHMHMHIHMSLHACVQVKPHESEP